MDIMTNMNMNIGGVVPSSKTF